MPAGTISLRIFILGLLAQQPRSGYDIKRSLQSLRWLVGSPSPGSLYPILHSLLQEGSVSVATIPGIDRPPRKIYSITAAGKRSLEDWLDDPIAPDAPLKAFLMRLLLAGNFSRAALSADLQQRRSQVADQKESLQEMAQAYLHPMACEEADLGECLAVNYGLALAVAELDWLDHTLVALSGQGELLGLQPTMESE